jgi:hypothetical protein
LIGADYFVTPMAADLFSLYALDNIAGWFQRFMDEYAQAWSSARPELYATSYLDLIPQTPPIFTGFLGYTTQQYVSRVSGGEIRHVQAYDRHRNEIPERAERLAQVSSHRRRNLDLGTVPNMFSMVPLAQSVHAPIMDLTPSDGLRGAQVSQQEKYADQLEVIFRGIVDRLGVDGA